MGSNFSNVVSNISTVADLHSSGHSASVFQKHNVELLSQFEILLCAKTDISNFSVLTSCDPWTPATDKDTFRAFRCSVNTIRLSMTEIEDIRNCIGPCRHAEPQITIH